MLQEQVIVAMASAGELGLAQQHAMQASPQKRVMVSDALILLPVIAVVHSLPRPFMAAVMLLHTHLCLKVMYAPHVSGIGNQHESHPQQGICIADTFRI